jgi:MFS family permease
VKPLRVLLVNRDLRWLFGAQVVSYMGDWFAYVALAGRVHDLTDSDLLVSLLFVLESLPIFFMLPLAGPVVDRYDRRRVIILVSCGQALAALGMLAVRSEATVPIGLLCVTAIAALAAFVAPAIQAAIPNLARNPEELNAAAALFGSTWGLMLAVGAAAGGAFAAAFGRDAAFVANAASFLLAAVFVALIAVPMQRSRTGVRQAVRPLADMAEATRVAQRDHVLLALISSKTTVAIGSGIVALLVVFADEELGGGDASRGLLLAARGVGAAIGPMIAARLVGDDLSRVLTVCGAAGLVFATGYLALSLTSALALGLLFVAVAHVGAGAQWTLSTYGLQIRAPDDVRGRILAGDFALVTLVLSISGLVAGIIAETTGELRLTLAGFSLVAAGAAAANLTLTRGLRRRLRASDASPVP